MKNILETLKEKTLLADGAMGTQLYKAGFFINQCYENINIQNPSKIEEIHKAYINAGADVIETNTFGASKHKLSQFGLASSRIDIITKAVKIAKQASLDSNVYVAGSIGPLGRPYNKGNYLESLAMYKEQAEVLAGEGVDFILLETFYNIDELEGAVEVVRKITDLPIASQLSIRSAQPDGVYSESDPLSLSENAELAAKRMNSWENEIIGLNCGTGPVGMLDYIKSFCRNTNKIVSAMPNAGSPEQIGDRMLYMSTPEYIGEYTARLIKEGVSLVGGCCGTLPAHTKEMRNVISSIQPKISITSFQKTITVNTDESKSIVIDKVPLEERSDFAKKILSGKFVTSVEVNPPRGIDYSKQILSVKKLIDAGVDAVNIADGPRATSRMSPLSMALKMREETGIETIIHYCCRDRNIIGMQSDLMGNAALGLNNILLITGDRPKVGDYPDATAVFDLDAIGLTAMAETLNGGEDLIGNPIGKPTSFFIGVGADPGASNFDDEIRRLEKKVEAGAQYVMTQPVFNIKYIERFLKASESLKIPVLIGILPLFSSKNAEFLHNEVPGMEIPKHIRDRMRRIDNKDKAILEGIQIGKEILHECKSSVQGVYIMPPFGRVDLAIDLLNG